MGAQVSLDRNRRLNAALHDGGESPFDNLVRELPSAVLAAYAERTDDARHRRSFVTQVTRALEELGRESTGRPNKLTNLVPEVAVDAPEDEWIAELDRKETLDALERATELSPQQKAVCKRLRQDKSISEIADELGIPKNQVSVQKNLAIKKLRKAREASQIS